mgnify:CR=1 FL=1
MGHLISFLSRIDAVAQLRFDSVCFFLMRRFGLRKPAIRAALYLLHIVGVVVATFHFAVASRLFLASVCLGFAFVWMAVYDFYLDLRHDHAAEEAGAQSLADCACRVHGGIKLALIGLLALTAALLIERDTIDGVMALQGNPHSDAGRKFFLGIAMLSTASLALQYLGRTPMTPPAEKAREHADRSSTAPAQA